MQTPLCDCSCHYMKPRQFVQYKHREKRIMIQQSKSRSSFSRNRKFSIIQQCKAANQHRHPRSFPFSTNIRLPTIANNPNLAATRNHSSGAASRLFASFTSMPSHPHTASNIRLPNSQLFSLPPPLRQPPLSIRSRFRNTATTQSQSPPPPKNEQNATSKSPRLPFPPPKISLPRTRQATHVIPFPFSPNSKSATVKARFARQPPPHFLALSSAE
jgi:hypothetical protein